jgi:hypothetical protein
MTVAYLLQRHDEDFLDVTRQYGVVKPRCALLSTAPGRRGGFV